MLSTAKNGEGKLLNIIKNMGEAFHVQLKLWAFLKYSFVRMA